MRDGRWLVGWGMATSTYPSNRLPAAARVILLANGDAVVQSGTQDLGTGAYTIFAQLAADALNLPINRVKFELGDSRFPKAPVSGGSMTTASVGPAVLAACAQARDHVIAMAASDKAADWPGVTPQDLTFRDAAVSGPAGSISLGEMLARRQVDSISFDAAAAPGDEKKTHSMHAFGAQFAEVRIDPDTGEIRVSRLVGAFDAGRVMNAKTAHSQLIGGMTFGLGMALLEETVMDQSSGRIVNANVSEYLLPVHADVPAITAILVEGDDRIFNPTGAKGIGELPMVGVAAAIGNAVYHAAGVRVRDLPIRLEDVLS
jgi:xanthine dehydrogenase YagR molybdenum-binding subunit